MATDVDVLQVNDKSDQSAIETAIQDWIDNNPNATVDDVEKVAEMNQRLYIAIVHTD